MSDTLPPTVSAENLDGHEVSKMEKLFLLKWKAIRSKAHRNETSTDIGGILSCKSSSSYPSIPSSKDIVVSAPALPLTLPALPMRPLPHKSKKRHQQHKEAFTHTESHSLLW